MKPGARDTESEIVKWKRSAQVSEKIKQQHEFNKKERKDKATFASWGFDTKTQSNLSPLLFIPLLDKCFMAELELD